MKTDPKMAVAKAGTDTAAENAKAIEQFKKDNMTKRIAYNVGGNEVIVKENVPVVSSPGSHVIILEEHEFTLVAWERIVEIVFPPSEKLITAAMQVTKAQEQFLDKMGTKTEDTHSFG